MGTAFLTNQNGGKTSTIVRLETSQSWTVPAGVYSIDFWMCGGGASGSGYNGGGDQYTTTNGGGSGFSMCGKMNVTPGQSLVAVIGAGGSGVTTGFGNPGGNTTFDIFSTDGGAAQGINTTTYNPYIPALCLVNGNTRGPVSYGGTITVYSNTAGVNGNIDGRTGTGITIPTANDKGFCAITNEIYCGAGGCNLYYYSGSQPNTGPKTEVITYTQPTSQPGGGGQITSSGSFTLDYLGVAPYTISLSAGSYPVSGGGTAYGAGGCSAGYIQTNNYTNAGGGSLNVAFTSGAGGNGVVIIKY